MCSGCGSFDGGYAEVFVVAGQGKKISSGEPLDAFTPFRKVDEGDLMLEIECVNLFFKSGFLTFFRGTDEE